MESKLVKQFLDDQKRKAYLEWVTQHEQAIRTELANSISGWQSFVDWVDEYPILSLILSILGAPLFLIPTILFSAAYFFNTPSRLLKDCFIDALKKRADTAASTPDEEVETIDKDVAELEMEEEDEDVVDFEIEDEGNYESNTVTGDDVTPVQALMNAMGEPMRTKANEFVEAQTKAIQIIERKHGL